MELILPILLSLAFPAILALLFVKMRANKAKPSKTLEIDQAALDSAEKSLRESDEMDWVVLKRCHGPAYNHGAMTDLVATLNAEGVDATYDVVSSSSAEGGVTNFMLKVLRGTEAQAFEVLARKEKL